MTMTFSESETFAVFDLGGSALKGALVTRHGAILERRRQRTRDSGPEAVLEDLSRLVADLCRQAGPLPPVGICVPGPLDAHRGVLFTLPNLPGWEDFPLRSVLEERLQTTVEVENDANAAAVGEWLFGAGQGVRDVIVLTVGTGIGTGVIVGNRLVRGAAGLAVEAGHMTIAPDGPPCNCGNCGCLEVFASVTAARRAMAELLAGVGSSSAELPSGRSIIEGGRNGDPVCLEVLARMGRYLGIGVANLINLFNPSRVLIGGGYSVAYDLFAEPLREEVRRRAFARQAGMAEIGVASLGNDAGLLGMVGLLQGKGLPEE
jgi:glucokinase